MNKDVLKSEAFQRAALKSESYRSAGLLILLGALVIFVIARGVAIGEYAILATQLLLLGIVIAHEVLMMRAIRKAIESQRQIGPEKWVLNVFVESQIPTVGLFVLLAGSWLTMRQVLVAPIVLVYFLLIILSTLRLNPMLTFLTGLLSTLGYLLVTLLTGMTSQDAGFPLPFYFVYAGLILTGGILAAIVAGRIRKHVAAALREAELKYQLDQVNHDLDIARSIQQDLLPAQSPSLENFDIAGWNEPANQTGGDYFDWQTLP